jgi:hypothetical protein
VDDLINDSGMLSYQEFRHMVKKVVLRDRTGNIFHLEVQLAGMPITPTLSILRDPVYARRWLEQFIGDGSLQWRELLAMAQDPFPTSPPTSTTEAVNRLICLLETGRIAVTRKEQKRPLRLDSSKGPDDEEVGEEGVSDRSETAATASDTHTCIINELMVEEKKTGRKPSSESLLQVVPKATATKSSEVKWHGFQVTLEKEYEGRAAIKSNLKLDGAEGESCYRHSITGITQGWESIETKTFDITGLPEELHKLWSAKATPRKKYIKGRGCDGATKTVTLEVYPDQQYSAEVSLDAFGDWMEAVKESWKNFGLSILNLSPVEISPEIQGPKGYLKASWGWQENDDWRAYFQFEADAGLDPVLGVAIDVKLSVVKLAATAAGIPPPINSFIAEHIADILLSAGVEGKATLSGEPRGRRFTTGKWESSAEATFAVSGALIFALMARIGSKYVISVSIQGSVETRLIGESKSELDSKGLFITPVIKINPFTAKIKVRLRAFVVISKSKEKKWTPWKEEYELWKGKKRKLFPK